MFLWDKATQIFICHSIVILMTFVPCYLITHYWIMFSKILILRNLLCSQKFSSYSITLYTTFIFHFFDLISKLDYNFDRNLIKKLDTHPTHKSFPKYKKFDDRKCRLFLINEILQKTPNVCNRKSFILVTDWWKNFIMSKNLISIKIEYF